jgi:hypothetical protein
MMNSHNLVVGEPEGKPTLQCEDKIKTPTKGLGCGNMGWVYVDQNWSPVADSGEQFRAESQAQNF